jgi:hypothetical protein
MGFERETCWISEEQFHMWENLKAHDVEHIGFFDRKSDVCGEKGMLHCVHLGWWNGWDGQCCSMAQHQSGFVWEGERLFWVRKIFMRNSITIHTCLFHRPNVFFTTIGTPSLYKGQKQLNVSYMRRVTDAREIFHHSLEAFYVDVWFEKGLVSG